MISIKKNTKGEPQKASGRRSTAKSIYTPGQAEDFQVSRGKFDNFLTCPRCFYLERVSGLKEPDMPGWALNSLTDSLLKVEFDQCRSKGESHRILKAKGLDHIIPYNHPEMDQWRDSLRHGIKTRHKDTNIILQGGVDDLWIDTKTEEIIVVDYKSQAKNDEVVAWKYLSNVFHQGYKRQMDFYNYVLQQNGYKTSKTSYFLVVNGEFQESGFNGAMKFTEHLIPYENDTSWIEDKVDEMIACMNSTSVPPITESCENCAYARERAKEEGSN